MQQSRIYWILTDKLKNKLNGVVFQILIGDEVDEVSRLFVQILTGDDVECTFVHDVREDCSFTQIGDDVDVDRIFVQLLTGDEVDVDRTLDKRLTGDEVDVDRTFVQTLTGDAVVDEVVVDRTFVHNCDGTLTGLTVCL